MEDKKLQCIVKADSNVVRITSVPMIRSNSGIIKQKKTQNNSTKGRWSVEEQLAFINSNLKTYCSTHRTRQELE